MQKVSKAVTYSMAETHIFPVLEPELHIESGKCECMPIEQINEKTGDITWIHKPIKLDQLIDQLEMF
jgi:hypothetical protein